MKALSTVLIASLLMGCATTPGLVPAFGGKTRVSVKAVDATEGAINPDDVTKFEGPLPLPVDGQRYTRFDIKGKFPAGVDYSKALRLLANDTEMSIDTGEGSISTQGQADMNVQLGSQTQDILSMFFGALFQSLGPAIGARIAPAPVPDVGALPQDEPLVGILRDIMDRLAGLEDAATRP